MGGDIFEYLDKGELNHLTRRNVTMKPDQKNLLVHSKKGRVSGCSRSKAMLYTSIRRALLHGLGIADEELPGQLESSEWVGFTVLIATSITLCNILGEDER